MPIAQIYEKAGMRDTINNFSRIYRINNPVNDEETRAEELVGSFKEAFPQFVYRFRNREYDLVRQLKRIAQLLDDAKEEYAADETKYEDFENKLETFFAGVPIIRWNQ